MMGDDAMKRFALAFLLLVGVLALPGC